MSQEKTTGELRVRTDFNASKSSVVDTIKLMAARTIDMMENDDPLAFARAVDFGINGFSEMIFNMHGPSDLEKYPEFKRLKKLALESIKHVTQTDPKEEAMTAVEMAAMWAEKAVTC